MTYATVADVEAYCTSILPSGFSDSTVPTKSQSQDFLDVAHARINRRLAGAGYSTPASTSAAVYDELADLEAIFAASRVYAVRTTITTSSDQQTKDAMLRKMFEDQMTDLLRSDLSQSGLTHTGRVYAGGISIDDKSSVEDDTDRVVPAFSRGVHDYPGISWGKGSTSGS